MGIHFLRNCIFTRGYAMAPIDSSSSLFLHKVYYIRLTGVLCLSLKHYQEQCNDIHEQVHVVPLCTVK